MVLILVLMAVVRICRLLTAVVCLCVVWRRCVRFAGVVAVCCVLAIAAAVCWWCRALLRLLCCVLLGVCLCRCVSVSDGCCYGL